MNETIRVKLAVMFVADGSVWPAGSEVDLPRAIAIRLLEAGQAKAVKDDNAENASLNP